MRNFVIYGALNMWLDSVFLWVYCMRYSTVLFLLLAATLLFLVLKQTVKTERVLRTVTVLALLFWFFCGLLEYPCRS